MACHLYLTIKPRTRAKRTRARLIVENMGGAISTSHFAKQNHAVCTRLQV